jgi:hypothetical protein
MLIAAPFLAFVPGLPQLGYRLGRAGREKYNTVAGCATASAGTTSRYGGAARALPDPGGGTSPRHRRTPVAWLPPATSPGRCRWRHNGNSARFAYPGAPRRRGSAAESRGVPGTVPALARPSATPLQNALTPAPGPGGAGDAIRLSRFFLPPVPRVLTAERCWQRISRA